MNVQLEKAAIVKRLQKVNDESLIKTFKNLLDYALKREETDQLREASIDRGLAQSARGEGRAHREVMAEKREQYKI
jgi:predicted transcriptional regulator